MNKHDKEFCKLCDELAKKYTDYFISVATPDGNVKNHAKLTPIIGNILIITALNVILRTILKISATPIKCDEKED